MKNCRKTLHSKRLKFGNLLLRLLGYFFYNFCKIIKKLSALKQMHDKRIMHRDLKPANIFIAQDGNIKVGDLGLGRIFSSETIEAYSKVGTPLYMSPEV